MTKTTSRSEARAAGLLTYFTGKQCRRGHLADRYVSCWSCVECQREDREARAASGEQAAYDRQRYPRRMASGDLPERHARRKVGPRCPSWVSSDPALVQQMREVYALAQRLGEGWDVDHLVPLKGRNAAGEHVVSGLHVPWNLRVRPAGLNRSKGSWFDQADPDAAAWEFETEEALCAHYAASEHWSCNPLTPEDLAGHAAGGAGMTATAEAQQARERFDLEATLAALPPPSASPGPGSVSRLGFSGSPRTVSRYVADIPDDLLPARWR